MKVSGPELQLDNDQTLVVGIDFGTTYSGIAWAVTERADRNVVIENWPSSHTNQEGASSPKVPTRLRYLSDGQFEWGFQIPPFDSRDVLSLFKLGLEPEKYRRAVDVLGGALTFENVDQIITDYLSGLVEHFMYILRQQIGSAIIESTPVQFVLTVPAIWSEASKQRTLEAFERSHANLPRGHSTALLSEPEAAAIAAFREIDHHDLKVNDSFVVVDAGGGTVDLITYTITALHPVVEVVEAAEGTGDFCGSSQVTNRFRQFLTSRFERDEDWDEEILQDAVGHFDDQIKRRFTMDSLTQNEIFYVPVNGLGINPDLGIMRRGRLSLRAEDMHMFFEPDMIRIIQLVKEQIALSNAPIRKILLVGGYGSSMYLRERLRIAIQEDASIGNDIEILKPPNSWVSVVTGAVMKGVSLVRPVNYGVPRVKARSGRKHYGYEFAVDFDSVRHESLSGVKYYDGFDGRWKVTVMNWIIKRGELISEDKPFQKYFYEAYPVSFGRLRTCSVQVYTDQVSDTAPLTRNQNVQLLCNVTANLDHIPEDQLDQEMGSDGQMHYKLDFQIESVYRSASTEYTLIHNGRRYDTVTAEYV